MYLLFTTIKMLLNIKEAIFGSSTILRLMVTLCVILIALFSSKKKSKGKKEDLESAPGPKPLPIIGSLHLMAAAQIKGMIPYAAFTALKDIYGNVFSITLGTTKCIVVNDEKSVREVLINKDSDFDSRPDFKRFDALFGGDKQNSLAFCNYTKLQTKRRRMLRNFTFPHAHSTNWSKLDRICQDEMIHLVESLNKNIKSAGGDHETASAIVDIKELVMKACGNIFNEYFCSRPRSNYNDETFCKYVEDFDKVFWEVNNGRACDFLPWLMPVLKLDGSLKMMEDLTSGVRSFVENEIIEPKQQQRSGRRMSLESIKNSGDFLDSLMKYIEDSEDMEEEPEQDYQRTSRRDSDVKIDRPTALFALEDILGGHCAVGNITLRMINDLAQNNKTIEENESSAQEIIQQQIESTIGQFKSISLDSKKDLHWLTAAMNETIRLTCSPIVPHQASRDSTINGYHVEQGTVIFINNHELSMSESLWSNPEAYKPSRFLEDNVKMDRELEDFENNNTTTIHNQSSNIRSSSNQTNTFSKTFKKPAHFSPFSMGRRSCMGYKIVQNVSYSIVATLLQHFSFDTLSEEDKLAAQNPEIKMGMLALAPQPFHLRLTKRRSTSFSESSLMQVNSQIRTRA